LSDARSSSDPGALPLRIASVTSGTDVVRFFFHQVYGGQRLIDTDGDCFPDLEAARNEAVKAARHVLRDILLRRSRPHIGTIEICDRSGTVLDEISFVDLVSRPLFSKEMGSLASSARMKRDLN
jgi:hypothetical protein